MPPTKEEGLYAYFCLLMKCELFLFLNNRCRAMDFFFQIFNVSSYVNSSFFKGFCDVIKVATIQKII